MNRGALRGTARRQAALLRDTAGLPSPSLGEQGEWAWDSATTTRGALYRRGASGWSKSGFLNREAAALRAAGWIEEANGSNYIAPPTNAAGWELFLVPGVATNTVDLSGGGGGSAELAGCRRMRSITGSFTLDVMPVGDMIFAGVGLNSGTVYPYISVSPAGVVQLGGGSGFVYKTLTGTAQVGDVFIVSAQPGHAVAGWMRGSTLIDFALFPASFARNTYYEQYGCTLVMGTLGFPTAGKWTYYAEVAL